MLIRVKFSYMFHMIHEKEANESKFIIDKARSFTQKLTVERRDDVYNMLLWLDITVYSEEAGKQWAEEVGDE